MKHIQIVLLLAVALCLFAASPLAAEPNKADYQSVPFLSEGALTPEVLLVLSKDHKMFQQAYNPIIDFDGDGFIDTGFNPSVVYYGYFDPYSCYQYSSRNLGKDGDTAAYFRRVGSTIDDEDEATIERKRPSAVPKYIPSPRAAHHARSKQAGEKIGICQMPHTNEAGNFSGNWLNFLTTSRFDVIRKVLYGGLRQRNTNGTEKLSADKAVVLEGSMVPNDAHSWGYDVLSDERWAKETPQSVYYDISKYTPFPKPSGSKNAHFFARTRSVNSNNIPIFRYLLNANRSSFNFNAGGYAFDVTSQEGRYWDWSLTETPNPNDNLLSNTARNNQKAMTVRVEVCRKGNISETEGCKEYPDGSFKPVGLLQQHGDGDKMFFGLLTGSYNNSTRKQGGVLRHHIDSISTAVNPATGAIIKGGLIWTLDMQRIAGRNENGGGTYSNSASFGSPIGEMLFEGVRYMAALPSPSTGFSPNSEDTVNPLGNPGILKDWRNRPNLGGAEDCPKPVIMLISDLDNDFDGDNFPGSTNLNMEPLDGLSTQNFPDFQVKTYLDKITGNEQAQPDGTLDSGGKYIYAKRFSDPCSVQNLSSLSDVRGICPNHGAFEGSYSAAAVAYYAKTHNFVKSGQDKVQPVGIDTYAISLASAYPPLVFPLKDSSGNVSKQISILPASTSTRSADTYNRYLGFINYFILKWETDKKGNPFRVEIVVNFEDAVHGNDGSAGCGGVPESCYAGQTDWDMDAMMKYTIELVGTNVPSDMRGPAVTIPNRENGKSAQGLPNGQRYYTFKNPDNMSSRDEMIDINPQDVGGLVITSDMVRQAAGVTMGLGFSVSGSQADGPFLPMTNKSSDRCATPPSRNGNCQTYYVQSYKFADTATASGELLRNPMWMAAKYGGFSDRNHNGVPDPGEWAGPDGEPKTYFQPANIAELPENLEQAFEAIAQSTSTGTATSASVNSILGGGISIQTLFYPEYTDHLNSGRKINWVGSVFGLFVDKWGNLREDTDQDGRLTLKTGKPDDSGFPLGDFVVKFEDGGTEGPTIARHYDQYGNNEVVQPHDTLENFQKIRPVWNTSRLLAENPVGDRKVYFGLPDASGQVSLTRFETAAAALLRPFMIHSNTAAMLPVPGGADVTQRLIAYILGEDQPDWRPRRVSNPWGSITTACDPANSADPNCVTWRLGDVINSKPVIVGAPALNFDLLYSDSSYYDFKMAEAQRRSMAYFGANDGMLHAVNLGFYGSLEDGQVGYKVGTGLSEPALGEEMWAYIPTSVLPHLQWLADPAYTHSYFVDLKPQISDVRIDGEWRTILIGGLRLGGRAIESDAEALGPYAYSEIFALDITDPEAAAPKLLWRYSSDRLGMSVGLPTVVTKNDAWYVVVASGPTTPVGGELSPYDGHSDQEARLIVLDPKTGAEIREIMVPTTEGRSFFTDAFLPMAANPAVTDPNASRTPWSHHTIYYGLTISRDPLTCLDTGAVYRLDMTGALDDWELKKLIDTERPVTGAVNAAYDRLGQLWVFFGTGRVWGADDLRPCVSALNRADCNENHEQYLFGVKEELDAGGQMTFADQSNGRLADVSGAKVFTCSTTGSGYVTNLLTTADQDFPIVAMCGLPNVEGTPYTSLTNAIMSDDFVGYKRKLDTVGILGIGGTPRYEMIVTQPKIDSLGNGRSIMGFTSFEPPQGTCGDSGQSYLHMVDTFTGLPAPYMYDVFAGYFTDPTDPKNASVIHDKQVTGYRPAGGGKATEAVIIKVGDQTIIRASAQDGTIKDLEVTNAQAPTSSVISWREATEIGFTMDQAVMSSDLPTPDPSAQP